MNNSISLTQKVNFYVSVAFILAFGVFMTITVVHAIDRDSPILQDISTPVDDGTN